MWFLVVMPAKNINCEWPNVLVPGEHSKVLPTPRESQLRWEAQKRKPKKKLFSFFFMKIQVVGFLSVSTSVCHQMYRQNWSSECRFAFTMTVASFAVHEWKRKKKNEIQISTQEDEWTLLIARDLNSFNLTRNHFPFVSILSADFPHSFSNHSYRQIVCVCIFKSEQQTNHTYEIGPMGNHRQQENRQIDIVCCYTFPLWIAIMTFFLFIFFFYFSFTLFSIAHVRCPRMNDLTNCLAHDANYKE